VTLIPRKSAVPNSGDTAGLSSGQPLGTMNRAFLTFRRGDAKPCFEFWNLWTYAPYHAVAHIDRIRASRRGAADANPCVAVARGGGGVVGRDAHAALACSLFIGSFANSGASPATSPPGHGQPVVCGRDEAWSG
jgi:hypothetical protein